MIPKVIHYCWFGGKELPELAKKCIASWEKHCPDYQIVRWDEDNFDLNCCKYVREAYDSKKYAFVTDYVRLFAMYTQGGIYMDTDVEVVRNLDEFLTHKAFSGFESERHIPTGIMASEKGFPLFAQLLSNYENRSFLGADGQPDLTTNVITITGMLRQRGFVPNGEYQVVEGFALYPQDVFCPYDNNTGVLQKTENTAAIHWFNQSWVSPMARLRSKLTQPFHRLFGNDCFAWLRKK